mgnify:CR=1 FL=1
MKGLAYQLAAVLMSTYVLRHRGRQSCCQYRGDTWSARRDPRILVTGPRNQDSLPIVVPQIFHDAGLSPAPYTGQHSQRKFLPQGGFEPISVP